MTGKIILCSVLIATSVVVNGRDTGARPLPNIVHMWNDATPDWDKPELFPLVKGIEHARVFTPDEASGGFNHHARILFSGGKFRALWSNHRYTEDGPGQRVLYASSIDGKTWSRPREIVQSMSPEAPWSYNGYFACAVGFAEVGGKLYAVSEFQDIPEWKNFDQTESSPKFTKKCCWPVYNIVGRLYREIKPDDSFGQLFTTAKKIPENLMFPVLPREKVAPDFKEPFRKYLLKDAYKKNPENRRFCEPVVWKTASGKWVVLFRDDSRSYRKWVAYSDDGKTWTQAVPTDILDAPSMSCQITLDDGAILLIGNHNGAGYIDEKKRWLDRDPLMISYSKDGFVFSGTRSIQKGFYDFVVRHKIKNRGGSAQYPSAILKDGKVYVIYSLRKESIEVASFKVSDYLDEIR